MSVEVAIDPDLCIGSGDCVRIAPVAFELDDDAGVSRPTSGADATDLAILLEAARSCPTQAITIERDGLVLRDPDGAAGEAPERP